MDIIGNYKNVLTNKYALFKGRANRSEFWLFALVNVALSIVYQILISVLASSTAATLVVSIIFCVIALAILVPGLALVVDGFSSPSCQLLALSGSSFFASKKASQQLIALANHNHK